MCRLLCTGKPKQVPDVRRSGESNTQHGADSFSDNEWHHDICSGSEASPVRRARSFIIKAAAAPPADCSWVRFARLAANSIGQRSSSMCFSAVSHAGESANSSQQARKATGLPWPGCFWSLHPLGLRAVRVFRQPTCRVHFVSKSKLR